MHKSNNAQYCENHATNLMYNLTVELNPIKVKFEDMPPERMTFNFNEKACNTPVKGL